MDELSSIETLVIAAPLAGLLFALLVSAVLVALLATPREKR